MLPLDVTNVTTDGGLDMKTFWYIVYMTLAIMVFFVYPFSLFFYEQDEEDPLVLR
jgi:hypothetical protein